jgi:hypothetical protein
MTDFGGRHMATRAIFRQYAAKCIELSQTAPGETSRAVLLDMAASWLREAGDAPDMADLLPTRALTETVRKPH